VCTSNASFVESLFLAWKQINTNSFTQIDKIIDERGDGNSSSSHQSQRTNKNKEYLVKWCGLPYSDCTWELASDLQNDAKIQEFHASMKRLSKVNRSFEAERQLLLCCFWLIFVISRFFHDTLSLLAVNQGQFGAKVRGLRAQHTDIASSV
jgi:hypothetical protein